MGQALEIPWRVKQKLSPIVKELTALQEVGINLIITHTHTYT